MKTSTVVAFLVSVLALVAPLLPSTAHAADEKRDASSTDVCGAASVEEVSMNESARAHSDMASAQGTVNSAAPGYCYLDCSRCTTNQDCWSRGAGNCTSIPLCVQAPDLRPSSP